MRKIFWEDDLNNDKCDGGGTRFGGMWRLLLTIRQEMRKQGDGGRTLALSREERSGAQAKPARDKKKISVRAWLFKD